MVSREVRNFYTVFVEREFNSRHYNIYSALYAVGYIVARGLDNV